MDPSEHFLGLRLDMYVASVLTSLASPGSSTRSGRTAGRLAARRPGSEEENGPGPGAGRGTRACEAPPCGIERSRVRRAARAADTA